MEGVLDVPTEVCIQEAIVLFEQPELVEVIRNADRTDRVPNADAFDRRILLPRVELRERVGVLLLVRLPHRVEVIQITLADQAGKSDEAADTARRIGTARKSEEED